MNNFHDQNNSIPKLALTPAVRFNQQPVNDNFLDQNSSNLSLQVEPQTKLQVTDSNASMQMQSGNITRYQAPYTDIPCMTPFPYYCQSQAPINSDINRELQKSLIDTQKRKAEKCIDAEINLYIDNKKRERKIQDNERNFSNFHRIIISNTGEILVANNVSHATNVVCNLMNPKLCKLYHATNRIEIIYRLDGEINGKTISIYLDANDVGTSNYLYKKFVASGVSFFSNKESIRKNYAEQLFSSLKISCDDQLEVYDVSGWNSDCNGNLKFVKEGELLWTTLRKMTR